MHIFSRHCIVSTISKHKKRFAHFSREACYRNLLSTIDLKRVDLTFFLDLGESGSREDHFLKGENTHPIFEVRAGSEAGSFLCLLDYVVNLELAPDTIVYFVEDDYLHRPGWIDILLEGFEIPKAEYITLYDHRDKYFFPEYEKLASRLFVTRSCHWRTTPSTTQTFATRLKTLKRDFSIHRYYSEKRTITADHEKFCHLQQQGALLLSSLPGWSTHAEPDYASAHTDWDAFFLAKNGCCDKIDL